jgi:hypothetical protein
MYVFTPPKEPAHPIDSLDGLAPRSGHPVEFRLGRSV